jgi:hypothetical protein
MSSVKERKAIGTLFVTAWQSSPNLTLAMPNVDFTKPVNAAWARLSYVSDPAYAIEIGRGQKRFPGTVFVQIFGLVDKGDALVLGYADQAAAIFRDQEVTLEGNTGRILFGIPMINVVGRTDDGWFQVNVSVPFARDELF